MTGSEKVWLCPDARSAMMSFCGDVFELLEKHIAKHGQPPDEIVECMRYDDQHVFQPVKIRRRRWGESLVAIHEYITRLATYSDAMSALDAEPEISKELRRSVSLWNIGFGVTAETVCNSLLLRLLGESESVTFDDE